jgi:hypothetical protein
MHILDLILEAGDSSGNGLHLYCLTRQHAINQVIACPLIYNMNLAYSKGARLDYYDMISTVGDFSMAVITLAMLLFVLSC